MNNSFTSQLRFIRINKALYFSILQISAYHSFSFVKHYTCFSFLLSFSWNHSNYVNSEFHRSFFTLPFLHLFTFNHRKQVFALQTHWDKFGLPRFEKHNYICIDHFCVISFAHQTVQYIVVGQAWYQSVSCANKCQKNSTTDLNVLGFVN